MSQHDFEIANQGFPSFRSDLNSGLQALASNSAGATAPSTTYAYQFWYDSTANLLKMRNTDDDAWITLAYFDQTNDEWEVRSAVIQAVDASGVVIKTDDGTTRLTIADDGTATFANNVTFQSNAFFGDNDTIRMGDGNDLSIYFNGTHSYFQGDAVRISSNNINLMNGAATENYIVCTNNAGVDLKYDNANKLQTTSSGVSVTGGITFDGGSNYLDEYEFGTFTPVITASTTNPTYTITQNKCWYIMIGRLVEVHVDFDINTTNVGSGQIQMALPVTCESTPQSFQKNFGLRASSFFFNLFGYEVAGFPSGSNYFFQKTTAVGGVETSLTHSDITTGAKRVCFTVSYLRNI